MYHFELTPGPRVPRGAEPELSCLSCVGEWFSCQSVDVDLRSGE